MININSHTKSDFQKILLTQSLSNIFGTLDKETLDGIEKLLTWVEIKGNEILFEQNTHGDFLYFVISGRLQVFVTDSVTGKITKMGNIKSGETIGEMAILMDEPRSASVMAIRDSILVKLTAESFKDIIASYPAISMNVTQLIIKRLKQSQNTKKTITKPTNLCLIGLHSSLDLRAFANDLQAAMQSKGEIKQVTSSLIAQKFAIYTDKDTYNQQVGQWLDEIEQQYSYVFYLADATDTEWTRRCLRQADEVVWLADTQQKPDLTVMEKNVEPLNVHRSEGLGAKQTLLLMHPPTTLVPSNTAEWLKLRPTLQAHYHLRNANANDFARIARILSNTAIGLVFAGGGAKGFAHIGVLKALKEFNIPIDYVGGTSVGAMMAATVAFDQSIETVIKYSRTAAFFNPTKDYNWFPFISLVQGKRIEQMLQNCVVSFAKTDKVNIEDLWLTFFCVSSNYSQAKEVVHTRGPLVKSLCASTAIPGVFPPIIEGNDFLIDGGTFNNFPADVMTQLGVSKVIGSEFVLDKEYQLGIEEIPSTIAMFKDKFRPKARKKYRLPGIITLLLNTTILYSTAKRNQTRQHIDLYFKPDVKRFNIIEWKSFDAILERGYAHAKEVLGKMTEEELRFFQ